MAEAAAPTHLARRFALAGAVVAFVCVAAGAFGAHTLAGRVPAARLATFETGARYGMYHALALFAVAWAMGVWPARAALLARAGWLFVAGVVLFTGSLFALVLLDARALGAVTPLGGVCFLAGWALFAWAARPDGGRR